MYFFFADVSPFTDLKREKIFLKAILRSGDIKQYVCLELKGHY